MSYEHIYFLGIGGIGMSAIARYFLHEGKQVAGYDRTPSPLTAALEVEGAQVHYEDDPSLISAAFRDPATTLVVYTPAIPAEHAEWAWFREHGFQIEKRSEMLGHISEGKYVMAVAGTHGKTTTTTLTAWLNHEAGCGTGCEETDGCGQGTSGCGSAFLGGISKNFDSNLVLGRGKRLAVEADEFDRSFLRLHPDAAVITSADADHLDIYGTHEAVKEAFSQFVRQIRPGGALVIKQGVDVTIDNPAIRVYRYAYDTPCDFYARNVTLIGGGHYRFDIVCPDRVIADCTLGVPGWVNIENAVAAVALVWVAGFDEERLRGALASFSGVRRRFDFYINRPELVYMDDYAHHPRELAAAITSVKRMFPGRQLTAVFQPHLYTRTRDFYPEFAQALSHADQVILLPIYPARELPIEGVTSELIADRITVPCELIPKEKLVDELLACKDLDVLVTFGAGDIDRYCQPIADALNQRLLEK